MRTRQSEEQFGAQLPVICNQNAHTAVAGDKEGFAPANFEADIDADGLRAPTATGTTASSSSGSNGHGQDLSKAKAATVGKWSMAMDFKPA